MVDITLILSIAAVLALVVLNGVFVAAEFAIVRVRRTRLEELAGEGKEDAKVAIELVDQLSDYLTTTQVGITMASLGVGWIGENAFARLLSSLAPATFSSGPLLHGMASSLAFGFVTMLLVVIGEIVPKNLAITKADHFLMALARPLRALSSRGPARHRACSRRSPDGSSAASAIRIPPRARSRRKSSSSC